MELKIFKRFRRKKSRMRNGLVEKYANNRNSGNKRALKGMLPRAVLGVAFVVVAVLLLPPMQRVKPVAYGVGEIADRDVIAPFDFKVGLSSDEVEFARVQQAMKVPPVYVRDRSIEIELSKGLSALFDTLSTVINQDTLKKEEKLRIIDSLLPYVSDKKAELLLSKSGLSAMRRAVTSYQKQLLKNGLIDNSAPLRRGDYNTIVVLDGNKELRVSTKDVIDQGRLDQVIREASVSRFRRDREKSDLFYELVRMHILPNLILDVEETQQRRNLAMGKVKNYFEVSKNQKIVGKYDKVTADQVRILKAMEVARASRRAHSSVLVAIGLYTGESLRLILFVLLFGGYLFLYHRKMFDDFQKMIAIFSIMLVYVIFMTVVVRFSLNPFLIPVAFVALMFAALFDFQLGLVATVMACILIPLVTDFPYNVSFVSLLGGATAVIGMKRLQARSHFYSVFLYISLAYVVGIFSIELGQAEEFKSFYSMSFWGIGNALFSIISVMFLLPIFENVLNLTTRFTLLELTDLNKPILKRMLMEAPGTYHHSMLIGNLVDSVARSVGADPLKARVMAYYHDIGKIFKPGYYGENQDGGFDKHEKITPKMSSLILLSHVKDGVELAREEKLPDLVIDAIKEHHGTTVMAYFYQKALETDSHSSVNKDDFRYPGPKPQSKESALLMLADMVEAACRSLKDPTPAHIRNIVTKLIDTRAQEGELDDSGFTLKDLAKIREQFITILTGIYHKRVAYPGQEKEEAEKGEAFVKPVG